MVVVASIACSNVLFVGVGLSGTNGVVPVIGVNNMVKPCGVRLVMLLNKVLSFIDTGVCHDVKMM